MNTTHVVSQIHDYIDGELSAEARTEFDRHIATCASCSEELRSMSEIVHKVGELPKTMETPQGFMEELNLRLPAKPENVFNLEHRTNGVAGAHASGKRLSSSWRVYYAIAAAVVLIGASVMVWQRVQRTPTNGNSVASHEEPSAQQNVLAPPAAQQPKVEAKPLAANGMKRSFAKKEASKLEAESAPIAAGAPQALHTAAGRISGRIIYANGQPLPGAIVTLPGTTLGAVADLDGKYALIGVPPGTYALRYSYVGFKDDTLPNVRVGKDEIVLSDALLVVDSASAQQTHIARGSDMVNSFPTSSQDTMSAQQPQVRANRGTGKIIGRIRDGKGQPLPGAIVVVVGTTRGAQTDVDGKYTIVGVPSGTYSLKFSMVGFDPKTITNVRVSADEVSSRDAELVVGSYSAKAVEITADKDMVNSMTTSAQVNTTPKQMENSGNGANGVAKPTEQGAVSRGYNSWHPIPRPGRNPYPNQYRQNGNTEEYQAYTENEFLHVNRDALSTFSIDVDGGSYSNVRRFINQATLPPPDAVRTQELINYFAYDYPQPSHGDPISVTTEIAACPWNAQHQIALIGLQARKVSTDDMPASNLVFLLDVSGSMAEPNKLPLVKSAFHILVDHLRSEDRVSIVTYAGNAQTALYPTPGNQKERILEAIDALYASGGTNGGEGLTHAYDLARQNYIAEGNNRVILATDGDFNVGVSSDAELGKLIESHRDDGIYLTVLGFGMDNYKDAKMKMLADKGEGNQYYIDNMPEAEKVFSTQLTSTLFAVAKDVKVQVEFNPYNVREYRLIGYESRMLNKEDFNDDSKDAGEMGAGHQVTALYEIVPANGEPEPPAVDALKYQDEEAREAAAPRHTDEAFTVKVRYKNPLGGENSSLITHVQGQSDEGFDRGSNNLRWAAVMAEFGMSLRNSKFRGSATFGEALRLARSLHVDDPNGDRAEFLRLLKTCQLLAHEKEE